ncbi:transposase [Desulfosediminicola flagellatus]|uniref:transposase n=1 Tax=Desulfosediminicola flagellatus TaxID=2569541 RepID=UPI003B82F0C8
MHLLGKVPLKVSISNFVDTLKGRTEIRIFNKFQNMKSKLCRGNYFWPKGMFSFFISLYQIYT